MNFALCYIGIVSFLIMPSCLFASPRIDSIVPPSIPRGGSIVVNLRGVDLVGATVFVSGKGVTVGQAQPVSDGLRVRVTVSTTAPVGSREVRVASGAGVSEAASIWVGVFQQRGETEPNDSAETAEIISNSTVSIYGSLDRTGDEDAFTFSGRLREVWVADCVDLTGKSDIGPSIEVRGPDGALVGSGETDEFGRARIKQQISREGQHVVTIRAGKSANATGASYLLTIGRAPLVERTSPLGEKPGRSIGIEVFGENLGGTRRANITVPRSAHAYSWQTVKTSNGWSLPFVFRSHREPAVAVTETDQIMPLPVMPVALEGKFEVNKQARFYFDAKSGDTLDLAVYSRSVGSPAYAVVRLFGPDGIECGDRAPNPDLETRVVLSAAREGRYMVVIQNLSGRQGIGSYYRLAVGSAVPGFSANVLATSLEVPSGNRSRVRVAVTRTGGFTGVIGIRAVGAPAGVRITGARIAGASDEAFVDISVSRATPRVPFLLRLAAAAVVRGRTTEIDVRPVTMKGDVAHYTELLPVWISAPRTKAPSVDNRCN